MSIPPSYRYTTGVVTGPTHSPEFSTTGQSEISTLATTAATTVYNAGVAAAGLVGPLTVTYAIGAETANVIIVSLQFKTFLGVDTEIPVWCEQWLSSDAAGQTRVAATTTLAAGTDGTILTEFTSNSHWSAVSEADGDLDIAIGDAGGAATYYLNTVLPTGYVATSTVITFAA